MDRMRALVTLDLSGNPSLPDALQKRIETDRNGTAKLLTDIAQVFAHTKRVECARRACVVMLGSRKRSRVLRIIGKDGTYMVAHAVWQLRMSHKWLERAQLDPDHASQAPQPPDQCGIM